ncbi:multiheme c-type cytochrome [Ferrimonas sp.]|uniref:multiheme c-type cytochrome n=1 Tax=Ferrimonas sp. TaxID=2080861 RepID=UPI003A92604F
MSMDRRNALKNIIGITTVAAGATLVPSFSAQAAPALEPKQRLKYARLDPAAVAAIAYREDVRSLGCMYQVFHAIVEALANSDSDDAEKFANIPTALSVYGGGGVAGQGTVCGNNNATGMLYSILSINGEAPKSLGKVSAYYEQTMLPRNDEAFLTAVGATKEDFDAKVAVQTEAHSLLCHASLTRWSDAAGIPISAKGMRCQLLSASIAWRTVELLNAELAGDDISAIPGDTAETSECLGCHTKGENPMGNASVMAHMECDTCHGNL